MTFETENQKREIQRWTRFAIQLNGQIDSGRHAHITTAVILLAIGDGSVFDVLHRELPEEVWGISQLTDVDRHTLLRHWKMLAVAYEPKQFHVQRSGLALLLAYVLHLIDLYHVVIPK